jgi:hypothetical protein
VCADQHSRVRIKHPSKSAIVCTRDIADQISETTLF